MDSVSPPADAVNGNDAFDAGTSSIAGTFAFGTLAEKFDSNGASRPRAGDDHPSGGAPRPPRVRHEPS